MEYTRIFPWGPFVRFPGPHSILGPYARFLHMHAFPSCRLERWFSNQIAPFRSLGPSTLFIASARSQSLILSARVVNSAYASAWTAVQNLFQTGVQSHSILYCTIVWNYESSVLYVLMSSGSVRGFALQFKDMYSPKYRHSPLNSRILTWKSQICSHLVPLTWSTRCAVATCCWFG